MVICNYVVAKISTIAMTVMNRDWWIKFSYRNVMNFIPIENLSIMNNLVYLKSQIQPEF